MPIDVVCTGCNNRLRVGDQNAGKKVRCPKCQAVVEVPADAWYLKTPDGQDFGPVPRKELDEWMSEGRVTVECQILREGADQWQWATDVYPQLAAPTPPPPGETPAFDFGSSKKVATSAPATSSQFAFGDAAPTAPVSVAPANPSASGGFQFGEAPGSGTPGGYRPRSYPAALLAQKMYRIFGWLVIGVGVLGALGAIVMSLPMLAMSRGVAGMAGALLGMIFLIFWIALYTAIGVITLWFLADAIKVMLDIQSNTHKSSCYLEEMREKSDSAAGK